MNTKHKKLFVGLIGLTILASIVISLNVQVGFTAYENIEQTRFFITFLWSIIIIIITILVSFLIIYYEIKNIQKLEKEKNKKEEIKENAL